MKGNEEQRIILDSGEYFSLITHVSCIFGDSQSVCKQQISVQHLREFRDKTDDLNCLSKLL